jgi:uncharacterized membrane protein
MSTAAILFSLVGLAMLIFGVRALLKDMDYDESWRTYLLYLWLALSAGIFFGAVTSL